MNIDQSEIQRIKNGIQEGELILRAKKTHGRKLSKAEIEGLQAHLKRQKEKLNTMAVKKTKAVTAAKSRVKKASTALRSAKKKVTAAKKTYVKLVQTGSSSKKADAKRKALKPGKRVSASGKTYYEYRANRTDLKPRSKGRSL
jgi:hypothetical protein